MNADPEFYAALRRQAGVALEESMLQLDRAADCVDHAAKFDDEAVARALDHAPAMDGDRGLDQVAPQRAQARQDPILVGARQPRVPDDIRYENRRQLARFSHSWPSASDDAYIGAQPRLSRICALGRPVLQNASGRRCGSMFGLRRPEFTSPRSGKKRLSRAKFDARGPAGKGSPRT